MTVTYRCISCFRTGDVFNIHNTRVCEGVEEAYANLLKICFDITISENPHLNYMCENCILKLRQAYYFKLRVVKNLQALETALASHSENETPHNFESRIQIKEGLDPKTGQITMIVNVKVEHDDYLDIDKKDFVLIGNIEVNHNETSVDNTSKEEDFVTISSIDGDDTEETENVPDQGNAGEQLKEGTHFECDDCGKKFLTKAAKANHVKAHLHKLAKKHLTKDTHFECDDCGKKFFKKIAIANHLRAHVRFKSASAKKPLTEDTHFECDDCGKKFFKKIAIASHLRAHVRFKSASAKKPLTEDTHFECDDCGQKFLTKAAIASHVKAHVRYIPISAKEQLKEDTHFECDDCGKKLLTKDAIVNHVQAHFEKKGPFPCHICGKVFTKKKARSIHEWYSHRSHPCAHCGLEFRTFYNRLRHLLAEHGHRKDHPCSDCDNVYSYAEKKQQKSRTDEIHFECDDCGKKFLTKCGISKHVKTHFEVKTDCEGKVIFPCHICGKVFTNKNTRSFHKCLHRSRDPVPCALCGLRFPTRLQRLRHLQAEHGQKAKKQLAKDTHFECDDCGKKFFRKTSIAGHVKAHFGPFPCDICGKVFTKNVTLRQHRWRLHNRRRSERCRDRFPCALCGLRFRTRQQRRRHLLAEHGQREEFPCPQCDKVYSSTDSRTLHIREIHLLERRHNCTECKMGFFRIQHLLRHLARVHGIGEKKYICPLCDKRYNSPSGMRRHIISHSKEKENKQIVNKE